MNQQINEKTNIQWVLVSRIKGSNLTLSLDDEQQQSQSNSCDGLV